MPVSLRNLLRAVFRHDAMNREMNDEMRAHLERSTERLMARGMSRSQAEAAARREFGNVAVLGEQGRDARGASWVDVLRGDLRYAARSLRQSPMFAVVAILSLAIGIGANTAIFGLINAVMLRPLPVDRPNEIAILGVNGGSFDFSNPLFERLRDGVKDYPIAATGSASFNLASGGEEKLVSGEFVSGDYFRVLGVRASQGRLLASADDYRGCPPVAVVSHSFWRGTLGGKTDVVGSLLPLGGKSHTVIGVAGPEFAGFNVGEPSSVFVPVCTGESLEGRTYWWLTGLTRRGRHSIEELNAALAAASRQALIDAAPQRFKAERLAEFTAMKFTARPAAGGTSGAKKEYGRALFALMGMVGVVLLISCANVANLMLARGTARAREMAIRVAIGASRMRLIRQMLTECILLAVAGSALGFVLANWMNRGMLALIGWNDGAHLDVSIDWRVLGFTAIVATTTVLLCGVIPAWRSTRVDPQSVMKNGNARGVSTRFRIGRTLVVAQCALALSVVTMAGLLVGTLRTLTRTTTGFDAKGVVLASVDLKRERQGLGENLELQRAVLEGIRAIPGVRDAAITNITPVSRSAWNNPIYTGTPTIGKAPEKLAWFNSVGPGYFRTLRTRLLTGREFGDDDVKGSMRVAIVNQAFARKFMGGPAAVGKTFQTDEQGQPSAPIMVVGIVENAKYRNLREQDAPIVYLPAAQDADGWASPTYIVRSDLPTSTVIEGVNAVTARIDSRISLRFTTLEAQVAKSVQRERLLATLSAAFGGVAFLLSMIGLYGVMAYSVARRRVEIGVRIALGAARSRVVGMVLGDVGRMTAIGIVIGTVAAWFATPLLKQFLFGVEPNDPTTIVAAVALLAGGALLAGVIPARRAAALEPVQALRED